MKRSRLFLIIFALVLMPCFVSSSYAAGQLTVTVFMNQSYDPGQLVLISGQVLDENLKGVESASVSIQANDPNGNPIHVGLVLSSADGTYTDQFTAPSSPINGGYTVYVTASKPGYTDGNSQAACIITPEFPISDVPWLTVFPIALLVLAWRNNTRTRRPQQRAHQQPHIKMAVPNPRIPVSTRISKVSQNILSRGHWER